MPRSSIRPALAFAAAVILAWGLAAPAPAQYNGNVDRQIAPNYSDAPRYQTAQAAPAAGQQYQQSGAPGQIQPVQIQQRAPGDFRQPQGLPANDPRLQPQSPPPPPFTLTAEQQAQVDRTLEQWEALSGKIKTFKVDFDRMKYDPAFLPPTDKTERPISVSKGELKFVAPDKGSMEEKDLQALAVNPKTQRQEVVSHAHGEHWICDGKSLFKVDHEKKTVEETPIPPEMQGQAITQGPLPFVFGAKKAELKARYYIRITQDNANDVWLEIIPKFLRDAQNFAKAEVILRKKDMFPSAVNLFPTTNGEHEVFILQEQSWLAGIFDTNSFKPPFSYKIIPMMPNGGAPPAAGGAAPAAPATNDGQARRYIGAPVMRQ